MFRMLGGIFASRWLSYSVAGRGVVNICLDLLPATPPTPVQKRDAQHKSLQHKGAHAN